MESALEKITLFRSLFRGREDVFAIRWEKGNKCGYMPAYFYDPYRFRAHKMKGGNFQNYTDKSFLQLDDEQIVKHLNGEQFIGLYPLLPDNTSWFIVLDFDEGDWIVSSQKFIEACKKAHIPAYFERSRSGNGGHVWVFFDKPFPAYKSRRIMMSIMTSSGVISTFDKNVSFDRLFPNQDCLSGKGLGNLIALPLHLPFLQNGNNCFIDPVTLEPYKNQWQCLKSVQRVSVEDLDRLYSDQIDNKHQIDSKEAETSNTNGELTIELNNDIRLNRNAVTPTLINFLKEELNFLNSEFLIKKSSGRNTFGTNRYFRLIREEGSSIILPKGFIGKLIRFCRDNVIKNKFIDQRRLQTSVPFNF